MSDELSLAPRPGAAPLPRMVLAQAGLEVRMLLRNGEQVLLTLVVPLLLLVGLATTSFVDVGAQTRAGRLDVLVPGVLALAVMSTAFTGQAIATGFERRYGVLKRLAVSPLPRAGLIAGKTCAVLVVQALQVALVVAVAAALGWRPALGPGSVAAAVALLLAATAAFSGLGLLMAGTLRAEATLAAANLAWLLMAAAGAVVVPLARYPEPLATAFGLLPLGALSEGLRDAAAGGVPGPALLVLAVWALVSGAAAARLFRWE